jgi:hypothetical protein
LRSNTFENRTQSQTKTDVLHFHTGKLKIYEKAAFSYIFVGGGVLVVVLVVLVVVLVVLGVVLELLEAVAEPLLLPVQKKPPPGPPKPLPGPQTPPPGPPPYSLLTPYDHGGS